MNVTFLRMRWGDEAERLFKLVGTTIFVAEDLKQIGITEKPDISSFIQTLHKRGAIDKLGVIRREDKKYVMQWKFTGIYKLWYTGKYGK